MPEAPQELKDYFLTWRAKSEKFTERMNKIFIQAWISLVPEHADLAHFISPNEASKVFNKDPESPAIISEAQKRVGGCGMFNEKIYSTISEFNTALAKASISLKSENITDVKEIKGTVAYRPNNEEKIVGKVKVIYGFADMSQFKQGEVLVTEMTNPDYVPIMKMATAIITNEGGMTCHASIASRELKVPCIVGTKIATQVFRDGDMVEIDVHKGIVRLLK
jgi:phosphoenolpyruvate synthase/pyruvate phosphate dikinase